MAQKTGAFDRFVDTYHVRLFQYTYLMCGQREDAEEVSQEALFQVFKDLDQLRDPTRLKPWVFRIAKNACLTKRRKSVFAPKRELLEEMAKMRPLKLPIGLICRRTSFYRLSLRRLSNGPSPSCRTRIDRSYSCAMWRA